MATEVKICGLSTPETLDAAVDAGATHVGIVQYEKSPRHVPLAEAAKLRRRVPPEVKLVLVVVGMEPAELARAYEAVRPDVIQFHGGETPEWMTLAKQHMLVETWRAVGLREEKTLENSRKFVGACDRLLFDAPATPVPGGLPGGNGVSFRWDILDGWNAYMPWGLAGGLTADNVGEAIRRTGATLVDASSGVEDEPGVKNPSKIKAFVEAVRNVS
ncbi:phosphoribosylanthranilate isomerase [Qipengyuania sp. MTN3-11]|uniref:phosphoribosylanthranilate isomerase n=1 Tax=Qipengyuania sp. MTN3-11 TaxID=3056557 RepID=UPI0036F43F4F